MPRRLNQLLGLLVLTRAVLVISCADVFFYGEELGKGAAAKAILDRLPIAHLQKNYGLHEGGGFVVTHLKALAFLLVGENVLAHKLVALATTVLLLLAGWRLCRVHLGERAAVVFALLFVFCPAAQLRFSLLDLGTHFEALLFIALVLHFALLVAREEAPRARELFALGACAGFGLYFSLQTLPASACAAAWVIYHRRARLLGREVLVAGAGLALGALPLAWTMAQIGLAGLRPAPQSAGPGASLGESLEGLGSALAQANLFDWFNVVVFGIGALLAVCWSRAARLIAAWMLLFLALYLGSGMALSATNWFFYLRLTPLWFGGMLLFAAAYARLVERSRAQRIAARAALVVLLAGGLFEFGALVADARPTALAQNWRLLTHTRGYAYSEYLDKLLGHLPDDEGARIEVVKHFHDDARVLAPELCRSLYVPDARSLDEVIDAWRRGWGAGWEQGLPGLGIVVDPTFGHALDQAWPRIDAQPLELRAPLAEALGRIALGLKFDEEKLRALPELAIPAEHRAAFLRGVGWRLYQLYKLRPDRARAFLATLAPAAESEIERGWLAAQELDTLP